MKHNILNLIAEKALQIPSYIIMTNNECKICNNINEITTYIAQQIQNEMKSCIFIYNKDIDEIDNINSDNVHINKYHETLLTELYGTLMIDVIPLIEKIPYKYKPLIKYNFNIISKSHIKIMCDNLPLTIISSDYRYFVYHRCKEGLYRYKCCYFDIELNAIFDQIEKDMNLSIYRSTKSTSIDIICNKDMNNYITVNALTDTIIRKIMEQLKKKNNDVNMTLYELISNRRIIHQIYIYYLKKK